MFGHFAKPDSLTVTIFITMITLYTQRPDTFSDPLKLTKSTGLILIQHQELEKAFQIEMALHFLSMPPLVLLLSLLMQTAA